MISAHGWFDAPWVAVAGGEREYPNGRRAKRAKSAAHSKAGISRLAHLFGDRHFPVERTKIQVALCIKD